jgi:hypothetical protein
VSFPFPRTHALMHSRTHALLHCWYWYSIGTSRYCGLASSPALSIRSAGAALPNPIAPSCIDRHFQACLPLPHFPPPGPMRIVEEPVTNPADRRAGPGRAGTPTERFSPSAPLEIVLRGPSDPFGPFGSERPAPSESVESRAQSGPGRQPTIDPFHRLAGSPADQPTSSPVPASTLASLISLHFTSLHVTSRHFTSSFRVPLPTPHIPHPTARIASHVALLACLIRSSLVAWGESEPMIERGWKESRELRESRE